MAKVAIILRTMDRPVLLRRALASVLRQRYADWHLVVVNDGGAPAPVDAAITARRDEFGSRVTVVHHATSHGMEAASNAAIAASHSELVALHDDDDSWEPEFLAACVEHLDAEGDAMAGVATQVTVVFERLVAEEIFIEHREPWDLAPGAPTLARMAAGNVLPNIAFVYRRRVLDEIGRYREDLPVLGDWEFNLRFLQRYELSVLPRALANYHHRPGTTSGPDANTVIAQVPLHRRHEARVRNDLLRTDLERGVFGLGALSAMGRGMQDLSEDLRRVERASGQRAEQLERGLAALVEGGDRRLVELIDRRFHAVDRRLDQIEGTLRELAARRPPESFFQYVKDHVYNFARARNLIPGHRSPRR